MATITIDLKEYEAAIAKARKEGYDAAIAEVSGASVPTKNVKATKAEKPALIITADLKEKVIALLKADIANPHKYDNGYNFPSYPAYIVARAMQNPDKAKKQDMSENTILALAKDYGLLPK